MDFQSIDISALFTDDFESKLKVAEKIDAACKRSGFFKIKNHSIDNLNELWTESSRFFRTLTPEQKLKLAPKKWNPENEKTYRGYFPSATNGKEGLDMSNPTLNPNHPFIKNKIPLQEESSFADESLLPGFKSFMIAYFEKMIKLAQVLLKGFALAIGREENFFEDKITIDESMSTLRLNYYPFNENTKPIEIAPDGTKLGCETHRDGCLITLLFQPEVGGLQVEYDGVWTELPPSDADFVVNTGLCMTRWTNGVYKAANHRVRVSNQERISVPFFVEHSPYTIITSAYRNSSEEEAVYPPISYLEYITESNKRFKEYQR
jgi:isopenicillin-N synthase